MSESPTKTDTVACSEDTVVHNTTLPGIDLGIVVVGHVDEYDQEAIERARQDWQTTLKRRFPQFKWRVPLLSRPEFVQPAKVEAVPLLQHAIEERDIHGWDFCLLITSADLIPHYKARSFAAVSRMLDAAVISTSRVDPFTFDENVETSLRIEVLAERIETLFRHTFGHLCGLGHSPELSNAMFDPRSVDDLTPMGPLDDTQVERMAEFLSSVEDERLEELWKTNQSTVAFYLKSIAMNRKRIVGSVWNAKPWTFVRHLGRLTTAAASTSIVLLITAETWDLALSQSQAGMAFLLVASLFWATYSVLRRQRLLIKREHRHLTEQLVVRNVSTIGTILFAMTTTGILIFSASYLLGRMLFHRHLIEGWAASRDTGVIDGDYLLMATFVSSLSLLVGALGASFEDQYVVRHLTFVDEET